MAEDRIIIDVDDSAVDMAIAKLQLYLSQSQQLFGTRNITQGITKTRQATQQLQFTLRPVTNEMEIMTYRLAQLGLRDLPSLNREMRLILGVFPGAREAMWSYFGFKREYVAIGKTIESGMVGPGLILATLATLILIVRALESRQRKLEQRQLRY